MRWLFAVLLLGLLLRGAGFQGCLAPVRIAGASMAETLCGAHLALTCPDCRFPVRFDADDPPRDERVVCPNCGRVQTGLREAAFHRGQRVLIDRFAYVLRKPQRWELVAFRAPDTTGQLGTKRVLGLPHERLEIRGGDLYAAGRIVRKSLAQLRTLAVLVHDSDYRPPAALRLPPRWAAAALESGWRADRAGWVFAPRNRAAAAPAETPPPAPPPAPAPATAAVEPDWLTYRHWRCCANPAPRTAESPILDNDSYNQQASRQLHPVSDLLLLCALRAEPGDGTIAVRLHDGHDTFQARLQLTQGGWPRTRAGTARLLRNGDVLQTASLPCRAYARGVRLAFAVCDRQAVLAIDERVVLEQAYEPAAGPRHPAPRPLAVGAAGLCVHVTRLQVFRDVYYLDPAGTGRAWSAAEELGPDEFFLVGDNVAVSRDSRHWSAGGLGASSLLGRVVPLR